jgi:hypothetical protein
MDDLAQQVDGNAKNEARFTNPSPKLLKFSGTHPRTVYVRDFGNSTAHLPGFALHETDTYFTGGIHWEFPTGTETAMFVTFKFVTDVAGIDCDDLEYSAVYGENGDRQDLCTPALECQYQFTVSFSDGTSHDPRIVVTPVSTDPDA